MESPPTKGRNLSHQLDRSRCSGMTRVLYPKGSDDYCIDMLHDWTKHSNKMLVWYWILDNGYLVAAKHGKVSGYCQTREKWRLNEVGHMQIVASGHCAIHISYWNDLNQWRWFWISSALSLLSWSGSVRLPPIPKHQKPRTGTHVDPHDDVIPCSRLF